MSQPLLVSSGIAQTNTSVVMLPVFCFFLAPMVSCSHYRTLLSCAHAPINASGAVSDRIRLQIVESCVQSSQCWEPFLSTSRNTWRSHEELSHSPHQTWNGSISRHPLLCLYLETKLGFNFIQKSVWSVICLLYDFQCMVLSAQRCLCLPAGRRTVLLSAPQPCDFSSAIQPVQPGAVGTAWTEHEFDSVGKIYILGHLTRDWQPGGANVLSILNNELF